MKPYDPHSFYPVHEAFQHLTEVDEIDLVLFVTEKPMLLLLTSLLSRFLQMVRLPILFFFLVEIQLTSL